MRNFEGLRFGTVCRGILADGSMMRQFLHCSGVEDSHPKVRSVLSLGTCDR